MPPGLLGIGHEEAPRTKPGCVTPRFLLLVSSFPGGELAFVVRSPTVTFPWSRAIRNSLHLLWLTNGSWKVWRGWLAVILVLSLCRRWNAGCDRLSEVTQYGPVESASGSVGQDGPRFTAKAFD